MKKTYESPEFNVHEVTLVDIICDSKTEGGAGGGDWGGGGEFGDDGW
jgi:hypothetical protein